MAFTLCSSAAIVIDAGVGVSSTAKASEAILIKVSEDAEGAICLATRYDWISNYSAIASWAKLALSAIASAKAGMELIRYDTGSYSGRGEAEDMINVLYDRYMTGISNLKNYKRPKEEA